MADNLRDWELVSSGANWKDADGDLVNPDYTPETAAARKTRDIERMEEGITSYSIDVDGADNPPLPSIYRMLGGGGFSKRDREVRYYGDGTGSQADRKERYWDRQDEGVTGTGDELRYSTVGRKPRRYREPSVVNNDGTNGIIGEDGFNEGTGTGSAGGSEGAIGSTAND